MHQEPARQTEPGQSRGRMGSDLPLSVPTQTAVAVDSSSPLAPLLYCSDIPAGIPIITAFLAAKFLLLLPLSLLVLCLGLQRWRQQRSLATAKHSDACAYHSAAVALIYVTGFVIYYSGKHSGRAEVVAAGYYLFSAVLPAETSFHILTCVERYLAAVHPIAYRGLRQSAGVRLRNASAACVWLLSLGWIGVTALSFPRPPHVPYFCFLAFSLVVVSFCSLSVLRVLLRPGPGATARAGERRSKQRAFHTIAAVTGMLWLFFLGFLASISVENSRVLSHDDGCLLLMFAYWFSLPSSLVLPLLFLQRARTRG